MKIENSKKMSICVKLAEMKKKKINDDDIQDMAVKENIPFLVLQRAWKNFYQTGGKTVNKREYSGFGTIKMTPTVKCTAKARSLTFEEAASIVYDYITTNVKSREFCNNHNISVNCFYNLIDELNTSGTLLGKTILNPKKYAKVDVLTAIKVKKHPKSKSKKITSLSYGERAAYERVGNVLLEYLEVPALAHKVK